MASLLRWWPQSVCDRRLRRPHRGPESDPATRCGGGDAFDADRRQGWSLERAWIFAGNLAERISRRHGDNDFWTELIGIRNVYAHYPPSAIDYDRVWFDAATDIDRVIAQVREHLTR